MQRSKMFSAVLALGLAIPGVAMAQQTVGANGAVLDGAGAGGNIQNKYVYAGPANADVNSLLTTGLKAQVNSKRVNALDCDIVGSVFCTDTNIHAKAAADFSNAAGDAPRTSSIGSDGPHSLRIGKRARPSRLNT